MDKDMKIKHSVLSPLYKVWGNFLVKTLCMGEQTFLGKFMRRCFTWRLMTVFLGYWYIIWKLNTTNRWLNLKSTFFALCLWGRGFHVFFLKEFLVVTCSLSLDYKALLDLRISGSDSWRSDLRSYIQNWKGLGSNPAPGDVGIK